MLLFGHTDSLKSIPPSRFSEVSPVYGLLGIHVSETIRALSLTSTILSTSKQLLAQKPFTFYRFLMALIPVQVSETICAFSFTHTSLSMFEH